MLKIIGEVSSNHNQSLERAKDLILEAKRLGFHSVKFQLFKIEQLFSSEILERSSLHRARRQWELPQEWLPVLYDFSRKHDIKIGYTPFYLDAVEICDKYTDYFKVASYELLWQDLIEKIIETKKPLLVSTGMATLEEIKNALSVVPNDYPLTVFHCSSAYPTPSYDANLASIVSLKMLLKDLGFTNFNLGWSDHTRNPGIINRAYHKYDIAYCELHYDLSDSLGYEFKAGHCWIPEELAYLKKSIEVGSEADGKWLKSTNPSEQADRMWRTDPQDGLRPFLKIRSTFQGD